MAERALSLGELNRTLLARQLLLERKRMSPTRAVERLAGLQAEDGESPYVALHARLDGFRKQQLERAVRRRSVVRTPAMRSTLYLLCAKDYLAVAEALRPAIVKMFRGYHRSAERDFDVAAVAERARELTAAQPHTFPELRELLADLAPDADPRALSWVARAYVPLVQEPPAGMWQFRGSPAYVSPEHALGRAPEPPEVGESHLVERYLRAFGPATRADVAYWAGRGAVREILDRLEGKLRTFRDPEGRVLYDVPRAPIPHASTPAPPRLLARADDLILAHDDRRRIIADEHRPVVIGRGRMVPAFLVDGRVAGTWRIERSKAGAALVLEPFDGVPRSVRDELLADARRMLAFVEDEHADTVRFTRG